MKKTNSTKKNPLIQLSIWLLAGSLTVPLLAACGEKTKVSETDEKHSEQIAEKKKDKEALGEKDKEKLLTLSAEEAEKAGIKLQKLVLQQRSEQLIVTATIQANQDKLAHVGPRVSGRIVKVNANLGDRVMSGQTLAMLDSIELGEARSSYMQAASEASVAQAGFERAQRLHADNIIPEKDYFRARAEHEKARVSLHAASDKLSMMGVDPEKLSGSIFPLVAPFAGTIIEKKAVLGELATPDKSLSLPWLICPSCGLKRICLKRTWVR